MLSNFSVEDVQDLIGKKILADGQIETVRSAHVYINKDGVHTIRLFFEGGKKYFPIRNREELQEVKEQ